MHHQLITFSMREIFVYFCGIPQALISILKEKLSKGCVQMRQEYHCLVVSQKLLHILHQILHRILNLTMFTLTPENFSSESFKSIPLLREMNTSIHTTARLKVAWNLRLPGEAPGELRLRWSTTPLKQSGTVSSILTGVVLYSIDLPSASQQTV